ncbi:MAG: hypothetical protein Q8O37_04000 [Sulfuricellaceae bacterium]|nr:hypothetical protein [Sulfuricellaceae bacterium]
MLRWLMDNEITLSPRLTTLGIALRPVLARLEQGIDAPATPACPVLCMRETISAHFDSIQRTIQRLEHRIDMLMVDVVANEAATDTEIYRAASLLEGVIDELLDACRETREMNTHGNDNIARNLLADMYRHTLNEIRSWLADLVATLVDPRSALEKRGFSLTGQVELTFALKLTPAPQLPQIVEWARKQSMSTSSKLHMGAHALMPGPRVNKPPEPDYRVSAYDLLIWFLAIVAAIIIFTTPGILILLIFLLFVFGFISALASLLGAIFSCRR